jgi:hypothetical protein
LGSVSKYEAMRGSICRHHRFVGGVAVGGEGFPPMPAETVPPSLDLNLGSSGNVPSVDHQEVA